MRFYHLSPSDLEALSPEQQHGLIANMRSLQAEEALAFQATVGALFDTDANRRESQMQLAQLAYAHDPASLAIAIEAITRK